MKKWVPFLFLFGLLSGTATIAFAENGEQPKTPDEGINDSKRQRPGYQPVPKCTRRCDANGENCWNDCG